MELEWMKLRTRAIASFATGELSHIPDDAVYLPHTAIVIGPFAYPKKYGASAGSDISDKRSSLVS